MNFDNQFASGIPKEILKEIGGYNRRFPAPDNLPRAAAAICPRCLQVGPIIIGVAMKPINDAYRPLVQCEGCGKRWMAMNVDAGRPKKPDWMKE